jgi:elongation factor Ts
MAEITAARVKELREKTGAGMMDCKKALTETDGDMETAVDWLRKQGLAAAAKKAGRVAAEGLVGVATADGRGGIVEINAETDFVARNETFQEFVETVTNLVAGGGVDDAAALAGASYPGGGTVEEKLTEMISTIGENMELRRADKVEVGEGVVAMYVHNAQRDGLGKIGVLVGLESAGDKAKLTELGKQIAMHVAASSPLALSADDLDPTVVERERNVLIEQAKASGKPDDIVEKMVDGRIRKFYEEVCLMDQVFVIDNETKISKVVAGAADTVGAPVKVTGFVRYALGEGIEKKEEDFASEVAATLNA